MDEKHAYWTPVAPYRDRAKEYKCSGRDGCGRSVEFDYYKRSCDYDFCPYCGANMDGGPVSDLLRSGVKISQ